MPDRYESVDFAERWLNDAFRVIETPGGFVQLDVDMSRQKARVAAERERGAPVTYNHVLIRAAALVLAAQRELHHVMAGTRRVYPERVDIGLSVAGKTHYAPVMVIEDVAKKSLAELGAEVQRRVPEILAKEEKDLASVRRWGWLIPFGFLRRALLRWLFTKLWFRRQLSGTFQISCMQTADLVVPFLFNSASALGVGRVHDKVVPVDGQPAVRPMVTLTCCIDHKAWDGARAATFLGEIRKLLESDAPL
jgi:pyruvate/2-oxoglutarate dehydrogenase complex dihydrolipoamide acyltransferase (E2) component